MKRILAMLLSVICVLSFTCVSTYADEKSEDEEKAASIAESYLSAAAKNMWLYESNNLAEHTIQELVDTSGNSLLSDRKAVFLSTLICPSTAQKYLLAELTVTKYRSILMQLHFYVSSNTLINANNSLCTG